MDTQQIILDNSIDLSAYFAPTDHLITISMDGEFADLLWMHIPPQYRTENGMFARIRSDEPKDYTFCRINLKGEVVMQTKIKAEKMNFHFAKVLPNEEILLVCGRCAYRGKQDIDHNARIFSKTGDFQREFILGDGIKDLLIDHQGHIWTSYFDEGVFGNFGWDEPLGRAGLVQWDASGQKIWEFEPEMGMGEIADCYAMTTDQQGNLWFYYYTDFSLVKLDANKQITERNCPISGSRSVRIHGEMALMSQGYRMNHFELFDVSGPKMEKIYTLNFAGADGMPLERNHQVFGTGEHIGFLAENRLYTAKLHEIIG